MRFNRNYRNPLKVTMMAGVLFSLGACSDPELALPSPPEFLKTTVEYDFGTQAGSLDTHFWTRVWDNAEAEFGEEGMRLVRYVMPDSEPWHTLKDDFETKLKALTPDWQEAPDLVFDENARAWAFAFRHEDYFAAWVGLKPSQSEGGLVPVNFITNLPDSSSP